MEGEAAAAVLQVLVQNLIDHSKKEISLIRGLDKEAAKLTGSLDMIQKFLKDAEMRSIHGEAVKSWLKKLEDAAFDAENVLDGINYHLLSEEIMPMIKPAKEKVLSCFCSSFNRYITRPRKTALRIKEINDNLDSIHKEASDLGLKERFDADVPSPVAFETDSFADVLTYVGRDDVELEIVEMLTNNRITPHDRVTHILSIVGMGGLGKTTLARKVFNHQKIKTHFGSSLIWVHVSQSFDPIVLFRKILKELNSSEAESRQDILKKLEEALKEKTYLLVLDDVWNEDPLKWEDFINSLSGVTSTNGNAIVVTTRNREVASIVNPLHTHELKGLSDEDCWSIIKAKAFGKEGVVPSEFQTIGRSIGSRCQGLPLAANVVGGVLRGKSKEKWLSIQEKWLSHVEGDSITKILRLSFDNLSPPSLKKCFAYCSMFPKGYIISTQELIEFWMAEGFLQDDDESNDDMESVGEKFISILLQNSLLQVAERDDEYGDAKYYFCTMHDLVHDLACSISGSSSSSSNINAYISRRVRYLFQQGESSTITIKKEESKHLRTLLLEGEIRGNLLSDFEGLHVLGVYSHGVSVLPVSIRKLIHLRHLDISMTRIGSLPEWICELHFLITLGARTHSLKKLPSTFKFLINLRHLYIRSVVQSPVEIGRLTHLRTLRYFRVGDEKGCQIEELGSLNNLKGELKISNLEKVGGEEEAAKARLYMKSKLLKLHLEWSTYREEGEANNDEDVLEGLQPHSDLNKLWIRGFKGRRFPSWTMKMAVVDQGHWLGLNSLLEVKLSLCSECEVIPMLGHLPNLKSVMLVGLSSVPSIDSSFYGLVNMNTARVVFPALERLKIVDLPKMAEWAETELAGFCATDEEEEVKVFPRLQYLEIKECKLLTSVPTHLSSSTCLKILQLHSIGVKCLPDCLFTNNPDLSEVEIKECPDLTELPDGLHALSSLEKLTISNCVNLKGIGNHPSCGGQECSFTSLRIIDIHSCNSLMHLPCEMVGSSLESLSLERLSSLENLPSLIGRLSKSPRLTQLRIIGVPNPEFMASSSSSSSVETRSFGSLRLITMDVSVESVGGILQGCCHSLDRLDLKGMETMDSLPESIQHLNSLSWLKFENFGMEQLPEWLGNLSSLRTLILVNCKKLRHLPSTDAMRRLTMLGHLTVHGCPELLIQRDSDSEWPKVSHVPGISINGSLTKTVDFDVGGQEEGGARKVMCSSLRCL